MPGICHECKQPLIQVDNRKWHLVGCLICNRWTDRDGNAVELSEKELAALYALRNKSGGAEADRKKPGPRSRTEASLEIWEE